MKSLLQLCGQGARWCGACAWSFALWSLWLVLALLLAGQLYLASTHELEVPAFVLRSFEERLAASGLRVAFGRTSFDPTGRVLLENARVFLPAYAEPVVAARAIYARLDPWALAIGRFEPRELRVTGASWSVPAMLSPSGRAEEILRDLDATLVPREHDLLVEQFIARAAGVVVSAHGAVRLPGAAAEKPLPAADFIARNFPALCRQISAVAEQLAALEAPALHFELAPSAARGAIASATLLARSYTLAAPNGPGPVRAAGLRIVAHFPILGSAPVDAPLELTARELTLPFAATAQHVRVVMRGRLQPAQLRYEPRDFLLSAESVAAAGFATGPVTARLTPRPLPRIDADILGTLLGAPLAVQAETDFAAKTARLRFDGAISPEILGPLAQRLGTDVRRWFNFESLECHDGEARFGPGWKFADLAARVALRRIDAYGVIMDEGHAVIEFDGHRLHAPEADARVGENFARGSYDQDLQTKDYRFLLEGQLRPLAISAWWPSGWWEHFFRQFDFPAAPPVASVDVRGRWGDAHRSAVFVAADASGPVIRGAKFDRVRTLLFVRPAYYDGIEVLAARDGRLARGTFTYALEPATMAWREFECAATSSLDLALATQMIGPASAEWLAPFKFASPPQLKLAGRFTSAAAPGGAHHTLQIEAQSDGEFRFHDFPLQPIAFTAAMRDDAIDIGRIEANFAGGALSGRARVWGGGPERRVAFDGSLKGASLRAASAALQEYAARQKNAAPSAPEKFLQEKSDARLDLAAAAEGRYDDPFSYQGAGNATLQGTELGEVRMLGLLSDLLKFTALRFTTAKAAFKVDGRKLAFPEVKVTGANSAIDATGDYALDRRLLDFKAKIYPLHESNNFLKKLIELGLSPLTAVLDVHLGGTLDKPEWSLSVHPTNLLRALAPGETPPPAEKTAPPPTANQPAPPEDPKPAAPATSPANPPPPPNPKP